ncbi:MAG: Flp pilus assembly complex ATPase component TadA [Planctomycetales bacterium]|nr:Flp pilus assembly complex ATPase component TadA [Planctomycetales bacterium]
MVKRLGDIVIERGWLTAEQLDSAIIEQSSLGLQLGSYLLDRKLITRDQLGEALSEQYEVPFQSIRVDSIHPQLARLLPESFARRRKIVPFHVEGSKLYLGMVWPGDMEAISETELMTGYEVESAICLADEVVKLLDRAFDKRIFARQTAIDIRFEELAKAVDKETDEEVDDGEADAPVVRLVQSILMGAVHAGASDIHLEPHHPQMRVRYRVDGQMQQVMTIPVDSEEAVIGRIKVLADLDTAECRRPQDGNVTIEECGTRASFRVSVIPCVRGEKIVMRVLDETSKTFSFDTLGMPEEQVERMRALLDRPHGMIVMTGPTGSGKTTTMYSMLCSIDSSARNVSTIEDPVEFQLPGINQVQANNEFGMGFSNGLKYLMRQDPDVILVGEIRDHETAATAVQAALTGHLLISTLHTNDAVGTVTRLGDLGLDNFKIAGALIAAVAQRLLRKLCSHCKQECELNKRLIESMFEGRRIPREIDLQGPYYSAAGCEQCGGTGYAGRLPIYEIMVVTPAIETAIESGLPTSKLREIAVADGMIELAVGGLREARLGLTSVEEVYYKLTS